MVYLLSREEYMGHTVNFKTSEASYKDKRRKHTAPEEQKRFENTQEAIIDAETWHTAQRVGKTVRRLDNSGIPNRLTGLLYCADCGANGRLSDKRFEMLAAGYEAEQEQLERQIHQMRTELDSYQENSTRADKFLELVRKYKSFDELTTPMLKQIRR